MQTFFNIETIAIIVIFALIFMWILRSLRRNKTGHVIPPKTIGGRIRFTLLYVLRIVGVGLGTCLAVVLFVMIERNLYTFATETAPAPSEVIVPPGLPFEVEEVTFEGGDGLKMAGWKVPSQNGVTIILLHGYGGNRTDMLWHAQQFINAGYGVLIYDERSSGESEGTRRSFGWEDPPDVQGAIRFIETEAGTSPERIGIAGSSMGGQIALQSAARYSELEAVWADGPSSVRARDNLPVRNPILALMILGNYSLDWMYELRLDIDAPPPMIEIIGNIAPRPIMLIGGGQPYPLVGSEGETRIPRYAHYAGANAQTWVIPEAHHCNGPALRPEEYASRLVGFFDSAFGIAR
jgi:uncharacterized protein